MKIDRKLFRSHNATVRHFIYFPFSCLTRSHYNSFQDDSFFMLKSTILMLAVCFTFTERKSEQKSPKTSMSFSCTASANRSFSIGCDGTQEKNSFVSTVNKQCVLDSASQNSDCVHGHAEWIGLCSIHASRILNRTFSNTRIGALTLSAFDTVNGAKIVWQTSCPCCQWMLLLVVDVDRSKHTAHTHIDK